MISRRCQTVSQVSHCQKKQKNTHIHLGIHTPPLLHSYRIFSKVSEPPNKKIHTHTWKISAPLYCIVVEYSQNSVNPQKRKNAHTHLGNITSPLLHSCQIFSKFSDPPQKKITHTHITLPTVCTFISGSWHTHSQNPVTLRQKSKKSCTHKWETTHSSTASISSNGLKILKTISSLPSARDHVPVELTFAFENFFFLP